MNRTLPPQQLNHLALNNLRFYQQHFAEIRSIHERQRERVADSAHSNPGLQKHWFEMMKKAFQEIDQVFGITRTPYGFPRLTFLDVGCCPGGFSSYILTVNPNARGTGLSLPVTEGGHAYLLETHLQHRHELIWGDITAYRLTPFPIDDWRLRPFPLTPLRYPDGFQLVLLDGHPLRREGSDLGSTGDRLLISQLIIGLTAITHGGTIIMKLSRPERTMTTQLLWLFDALCADLRTWKPVCIHGPQSTFYAIGHGIGYGPRGATYRHILNGLQHLWLQLRYADYGRGRRLMAGDLDFIVPESILQATYVARLRELSAHIWTVQERAWAGWIGQKIARSPVGHPFARG